MQVRDDACWAAMRVRGAYQELRPVYPYPCHERIDDSRVDCHHIGSDHHQTVAMVSQDERANFEFIKRSG